MSQNAVFPFFFAPLATELSARAYFSPFRVLPHSSNINPGGRARKFSVAVSWRARRVFSSSALYFIRVLFKSPCEFSRIPPAELGVVNLDRIAGTFESPQSGTLRNVAYFDNFSSCGRRVPLGGGSGVSICLYATNYTPHYSA